MEHRFRIALCPVNAVPLEPEGDHAADRTLDRTTAQRHTPASETVVSQSARLRVPGQVADLAPHGRIFVLARRQHLQFVDDVATHARFEKPPESTVKLSSPLLGQTQCSQRQAQVMHTVTPVEHLDCPGRVQFDQGYHPIQPRPDPRRAVSREGHQLGLGCAQSVQMERHQFDQRIRALQRAVDDRPALLVHPPLLIGLEHDEHFGLAPLDSEHPPLLPATDADLLDDSPHPDVAAINPDRDSLTGRFVARGEISGTKPEQVTGAIRRYLLSQFVGDSPHCFLVQFQATSSQLSARLHDWQLTDQAAHLGLYVGARSLADPNRLPVPGKARFPPSLVPCRCDLEASSKASSP